MPESDSGASDPAGGRPPVDRLDSWKEIAAYLGRDIRTVQRWEKLEGLPVHRHLHQQRGSAFAYRGEIDAWWATRRHDLQHAPPRSGVVNGTEESERATTSDSDVQQGRRVPRRTAWIVMAAAALLTLLAIALSRQAPPPFQATHHRLLSDFRGGAGGASLSPDGSMIAFHRAVLDEVGPVENFQIWIKNVSGGTALQLTFDPASSASPCWSPKGDQILFNHRAGIWSVSPLGGMPRRVIEHGANPRFSADGERVVFETSAPDRGIWIANADGSERDQIVQVDHSGFPASPALSPDGRVVAFFRSEGGSIGDIWVAPSTGGAPRRLTFDNSEGGGPVWTPDGRFIIFYSSRRGSQTLWRVSMQGGVPEPVTSGAGQDRDPDISRDGKRVVYSNFRISHALMLHDPVTGRERQLLQSRHTVGMPRFSPDGSRIAFSEQANGDVHVFTVGVDGKDARQVTRGAGQQNSRPHWSSDAAWLHFFQTRPMASLRRVSVLGGDSVELASPPKAMLAEVDPFGRAVAYLRSNDNERSATVIRELATGTETVLDLVIGGPRWSPDAQSIVGWSAREAGASHVVSCVVRQATCQVLVERGFAPVVTPDGSRVLFLRQAAAPGARELWSILPDGRDARQIAILRLGPDATLDVSRHGEIVFPQRRETSAELWQADLR